MYQNKKNPQPFRVVNFSSLAMRVALRPSLYDMLYSLNYKLQEQENKPEI